MELGWADLPPELLAIISDRLKEASHITRFRGVCRSWRSSATPVPNILSSFFPHSLSGCLDPCRGICKSRPTHLIANVIYLVRPLKQPSTTSFILSLRESEPGKLLIRHPLSYDTIIASTGGVDFSGWCLTRIAISHSFHCTPDINCVCGIYNCGHLSRSKVVIFAPNPDFPLRVGNSEAMALYCYQGLYALRNCLTNNGYTKLVAGRFGRIHDLVNFNGCIYAVDSAAEVYMLSIGGSLQLIRLNCVNFAQLLLNCVNLPLRRVSKLGKRFVVSDGDLYLAFNDCEAPGKPRHRCYIYKLVMDDINNATCYSLEKVYSLGDRVFFINQDCSFSVSAQDLHLRSPLVEIHIVVGRLAFHNSDGSKGFYAYDSEGKPTRMLPAYSALFQPPSLWIRKLQRDVSPELKKRRRFLEKEEYIGQKSYI